MDRDPQQLPCGTCLKGCPDSRCLQPNFRVTEGARAFFPTQAGLFLCTPESSLQKGLQWWQAPQQSSSYGLRVLKVMCPCRVQHCRSMCVDFRTRHNMTFWAVWGRAQTVQLTEQKVGSVLYGFHWWMSPMASAGPASQHPASLLPHTSVNPSSYNSWLVPAET